MTADNRAAAPLTHVVVGPDLAMSDVLALNDPDRGVLAMLLRPALKRANTVISDLLAAFGKDPLDDGRPFAVSEVTDAVRACLRAHHVSHVLVGHAQWAAPSSGILEALHTLTREVGAHLVLVSDAAATDYVVQFVDHHHGRVIADFAAVTAELPEPAATAAPPDADIDNDGMPEHVPDIDFPLFRAACRDHLEPHHFETVDRCYRSAFQRTADTLTGDSTADTAVDLLRVLLADTESPAAAIVTARAMQAAALIRDYLLKIDLTALPYLVQEATHRRLTTPEMRRLRRLRDLWRAAAAVLLDAGLDIDTISTLPATAVQPDGTLTTPGAQPATAEGALHLRAQHHYRALTGTNDPRFLPAATPDGRAVRDALWAIRRDLELPLFLPRRRVDTPGSHWAHHTGLSLQPLDR